MSLIQNINIPDELEDLVDTGSSMYNSISSFIGFSSLPPSLIVRMPPFWPANYSSSFHLQTENESVIRFIKKIQIEENQSLTIPDNTLKNKLTERLGEDSEHAFTKIFKLLNSSGITCIQRKDDNSKENHNRIFISGNDNCSCLKCLFNDFKIADLLSKLKTKSPNKQSPSCNEDYEISINYNSLPYIFFRLGYYKESLSQLEKQWELSKENILTKFLIEYNLSILKRYFNLSRFRSLELKGFESRFEKYDQYQTLASTNLGTLERRLLSDINQNRILQNIKIEVEELVLNIKKVNNLYKKGGNQIGPDYARLLNEKFILLVLFYESNFIFDLGANKELRSLVLKIWEGFILSFQTSDKYENKLNSFSWLSIRCAIQILSPKEIHYIFLENQIKGLEIEQDQMDLLFEGAISLFNSSKEILEYIDKEFQGSRLNEFSIIISNYIHSFLLFLGFAQVPEARREEFQSIISIIINHFEADSLTKSPHYLEFLGLFFTYKSPFFSSTQLKNYFHLIVKHKFTNSSLLHRSIESVKKHQLTLELDNPYLLKNLRESEKINRFNRLKLNDFLPLTEFMNNKLQEEILELVDNKISINLEFQDEDLTVKDFDFRLFQESVINNVTPSNFSKIFPLYLQYVVKHFANFNKDIIWGESGIEFKRSLSGYNTFRQFVLIVRQRNINSKVIESIFHEENIPKILEWVLNPTSFDMASFQPKWLFMFGDKRFLNKDHLTSIFKEKVIEFLSYNYNENLAKKFFELLGSN